jgi:hypothetical protein
LGFRLKDRDCAIIQAVNDYRALLTRQVEALFFTSPKPCYGRLKILTDNGFLERHYIPQIGAAPAASTIIYTLTKLGGEVLATTYDYTADDFNFPNKRFLQWETLNHLIAVNDTRIAITKACRADGFHLIEWIDEFAFRADPDYVWVKNDAGRESKKPMFPDGYAHMRTPRGDARFFIEVDRGTEGIAQFKAQIAIYQEYILSGAYEKRFQAKSLRVLIITTKSVKRLRGLQNAVAFEGGADRYWFTTFDEIDTGGILTHPIWKKGESQTAFALIPLT